MIIESWHVVVVVSRLGRHQFGLGDHYNYYSAIHPRSSSSLNQLTGTQLTLAQHVLCSLATTEHKHSQSYLAADSLPAADKEPDRTGPSVSLSNSLDLRFEKSSLIECECVCVCVLSVLFAQALEYWMRLGI